MYKITLLFLILFITVVIILAYSRLRYNVYQKVINYKKFETDNKKLNVDPTLDDYYNYVLHDSENKNYKGYVESDFENIDLSLVDDSYNICYVRKYLLSNPVDATIELAKIKDGLTILDVGCGSCKTSIYLCQKFPNLRCVAIEGSKRMYESAKKNIINNGLTTRLAERLSLYHMDFDKLDDINNSTVNQIINQKYDRIILLETAIKQSQKSQN